jgi:hypothetical protein
MPQGGAPFWRLPILGQAIGDTGRSRLSAGAKVLLILANPSGRPGPLRRSAGVLEETRPAVIKRAFRLPGVTREEAAIIP